MAKNTENKGMKNTKNAYGDISNAQNCGKSMNNASNTLIGEPRSSKGQNMNQSQNKNQSQHKSQSSCNTSNSYRSAAILPILQTRKNNRNTRKESCNAGFFFSYCKSFDAGMKFYRKSWTKGAFLEYAIEGSLLETEWKGGRLCFQWRRFPDECWIITWGKRKP